jgi:hypothetical protein
VITTIASTVDHNRGLNRQPEIVIG